MLELKQDKYKSLDRLIVFWDSDKNDGVVDFQIEQLFDEGIEITEFKYMITAIGNKLMTKKHEDYNEESKRERKEIREAVLLLEGSMDEIIKESNEILKSYL